MDCLVYQAGPRIRDRISHGEIDVTTVNRNAAHSLMTICCLAQRRLLEDIKVCNSDIFTFCKFSVNTLLQTNDWNQNELQEKCS